MQSYETKGSCLAFILQSQRKALDYLDPTTGFGCRDRERSRPAKPTAAFSTDAFRRLLGNLPTISERQHLASIYSDRKTSKLYANNRRSEFNSNLVYDRRFNPDR
jgi:hypothetical protein